MKINLIITAVAMTASIFATQAQDDKIETSKEFEVSYSKPYPVVDARYKRYFSKEGNIVTFKLGKGVTLQKFDAPDLNQSNSSVYTDFPKGMAFEDQIEGDDYVYILYSVWDKSGQTEQLYIRKINKSTGEFEAAGDRVIAVKGKVTGGDGNKFKLARSFDGNQILVYYRKKPESRNDNINKDVIGLYAFDGGLNKIWGDDVEMPYTEARMNNIDYTIDSKGNVFILTQLLNEGEKRLYDKDDNPNFTFQLISISQSGVNVQATDINLNGKYASQVNFFEGKEEGSLLLAGFYGNKRGAQVDGIFAVKVDNSGAQIDFKTYEIPSDIIKQFMSQKSQDKIDKKEGKGKDIGITNMILREISFENDGSVVFTAEKYYVVTYVDSKTGQVTYTHHYEEMLIAKVSKDGELAYMRKLPKRQQSGRTSFPYYRGGMGYKLVSSDNFHYLIFMDNVKNIQLSENKVPERHQDGYGGFLTAYQINKETGAVKKLSVLDTRNANGYKLYQFNTERIVMLDEDEFAVESYIKGKQDVMVKVKINE